MLWKIILLLGLSLLSCNKELNTYTELRAEIEKKSVDSLLAGWEVQHQNGAFQYSYTPCNSSQSVFNCILDSNLSIQCSPLPDSLQKTLPSLLEKPKILHQYISAWFINDSLKALKAGTACEVGFQLYFKEGNILLYKQPNLDNQIGFGYKRTPLSENWQLYTPQP